MSALGRADEAVAAHERAARLKPKAGKPVRAWARALQRAGRLDAAIEELQAEADASADAADLRMLLGHLYGQSEKLREAATEFQRAAELDPRDARKFTKATSALLQLGEAGQAIDMLRSIRERVPEDQEFWLTSTMATAHLQRRGEQCRKIAARRESHGSDGLAAHSAGHFLASSQRDGTGSR